MNDWIWLVWLSGFAVHALTQDLNRKQAAGVVLVQFVCGLLLNKFGQQLEVSGTVLLVNLFHLITAWFVQFIKRLELQKLKREVIRQCPSLFP